MIPEIGHFALILALGVAAVQGVLPLIGTARGIPGWVATAVPAARAQLLLLLVAFGTLWWRARRNGESLRFEAMARRYRSR